MGNPKIKLPLRLLFQLISLQNYGKKQHFVLTKNEFITKKSIITSKTSFEKY